MKPVFVPTSRVHYPDSYGVKPLDKQITALAKAFVIDPTEALELATKLTIFPRRAEGWFAFPTPDALSQYFPGVTHPAERYCCAVNVIHQEISRTRAFQNLLEGKMDRAHLMMLKSTWLALSRIAQRQKGGILIIPAQLGRKYAGASVCMARQHVSKSEFGLPSLVVATILLTHPERLNRWNELEIDCGDKVSEKGDGHFDMAVNYSIGGDGKTVVLKADPADAEDEKFGLATGFISALVK